MVTINLATCNELKAMLTDSIARNYSDNLLLSGGLDSSIVSSILHPKKTFTVALSYEAPDVCYARLIARMYSKQHREIILTLNELFQVVESVIHLLKTFDPIEIRNSSVIFAAFEVLKSEGYKSIVTGDGADELFAGYNYLLRYFDDHARLSDELARLWDLMSFSSIRIGNNLGIRVLAPYLDKQFVQFAKSLTVGTKVGFQSGQKWGKFILRQCFERELGKFVVWRRKYPQEEGSGFTKIRNIIIQKYNSNKFENVAAKSNWNGVQIRDWEHLYYFHIYTKYYPLPIEEYCAGERCPDCSACLSAGSNYCHTCGCFPARKPHFKLYSDI